MSSSPFEFIVRDGPDAGKRIPFPVGRFVIGSGEQCALRFPANMVREAHAEVQESQGALEIGDLTGASLLWVDGKPTARAALVSGTELRIGRLQLIVGSVDDTVAPDVTAKRPTPFQVSERRESSPLAALESTRSSGPRPSPDVGSLSSASGRFAAGEVIDRRYRIIARLASGGMGEVFKVEHLELGKQLALKVMLPGLTADTEFVNRFKIEAVAASRIGHPNIVDISDFGQTADGRFYFVMEFLDGLTLSSLVHRQGALPPGRVAELGLQVARALAAAHELQIVHRDLKPDNVMVLQRPGNPDLAKVLDFGVARVHVDSESIGQTAAGLVVGTPQYMSPEQAKALVVDARSDIYSLGLILHELLTGKPTFSGETAPIVMVKQVTEPPPPLPEDVPEELAALVSDMLEKNPVDRPQQMKDVVVELDALCHSLRAHAPTGPGKRPIATPARGLPGRAPTPVKTSPTKDRPRATDVEADATNDRRRATDVEADATKDRDVDAMTAPDGDAEAALDAEAAAAVRPGAHPLLIGVLLGLVLVVIGGGVLLLNNQQPEAPVVTEVVAEAPSPPTPTPTPEVPAPPAEVVVRVVSVPEGVEVFENGVMLGNTPLPLRRKPNTILDLTLSLAGYQPAQRKVMVSADQTVNVTLEKAKSGGVKPRPKLDLKSLPPDLDIKPVPF